MQQEAYQNAVARAQNDARLDLQRTIANDNFRLADEKKAREAAEKGITAVRTRQSRSSRHPTNLIRHTSSTTHHPPHIIQHTSSTSHIITHHIICLTCPEENNII